MALVLLTTALAMPGVEASDEGARPVLAPPQTATSGLLEEVASTTTYVFPVSTEALQSVLLDPTPEMIEQMRPSSTLAGDVVVDLIEQAGVWNSGVAFSAVVPDEALPPEPVPQSPAVCYERALGFTLGDGYDRNRIAQMTHFLFECVTSAHGLDEVSPSRVRGWNGQRAWGFESLAEQIAAEAVVVAYCESEGFSPRALTSNNPWGYGGLFQMGRTEMTRFGPAGGSKFEPIDNAMAAATYFVYQYRNRSGWGGWSPWAVVNTNFDDEVNNQVKVPILPRFASTDPEFAGRRGPELPAWAVDPWTWEVPYWQGCPYTGRWWKTGAWTSD